MSLTASNQLTPCENQEETKHHDNVDPSNIFDPKQNQAIPTFQEWQKALVPNSKPEISKSLVKSTVKQTPNLKSNHKNVKSITSAELILGHSPTKLKSHAQVPLLSASSKVPLTARTKPSLHSQTLEVKSSIKVKESERSNANGITSNLMQFVPQTMGLEEMVKLVKDNKLDIERK